MKKLEGTEVLLATSQSELEHCRARVLCCSVSEKHRYLSSCTYCQTLHQGEEWRFRCKSSDCIVDPVTGAKRVCPVQWVVITCDQVDIWHAFTTGSHLRGDIPCNVKPKAKITDDMKTYMLQQDELGATPKLIWSALRRMDDLSGAAWGMPTPTQVANAIKYLRKLRGTKNSVAEISKLARKFAYHVDIDPQRGFIFGPTLDEEGFTMGALIS